VRVVAYRDPASFREAVADHLARDEVRHNLVSAILATLVERPEVYPTHLLWRVEQDGRTVGAALRTPPHGVALAAPAADGAVEALVRFLVEEGEEVPGVVGGLPEADLFADLYLRAVGGRVASRTDQAIHVLEAVQPVPRPHGAPRQAEPEDLEVVFAWFKAFHAEALPGAPWDDERARRSLSRRLGDGSAAPLHLWDDEGPTSLVGVASVTGRTARVGPVYTPPERRSRGYATALTAHVSREALAAGCRACLLYTDLANPTSNAIYRRIGYRRVCDSAMILFAGAEPPVPR